MSDLLRLKKISDRNGDIKAFTIGSNFISANTGKHNWGDLQIAIDNESVHRLMNDDIVGVLYITTKEEWGKD